MMQDALLDSCFKRRLLSIGFIILSLLLSDLVYSETYQAVRGKRYCEVIFFKGREVSVYDTLHLNDCPYDLWKDISEQNVKKETESYYVYLNGPRQFIVDSVTHHHVTHANPKIFNHLEMHKVGVVHPSMREIIFGAAAYYEHYVERRTEWTYVGGKPIYELIDPHGQVYVMQSFAILPLQQTEQDLEELGHRLQLPKQWRFKMGILQHDVAFSSMHFKSIVIQDDLKNTYQKAEHDLL